MMNLQQLALNLIGNSPKMRNNPMASQYLEVIRSGDAARGEQIANNLLQTYGMDKKETIKRARNFFKL